MNLNLSQYYLNKLTSQYRAAANMNAWLLANLNLFQDVQTCLGAFAAAFDIDQAVGAQLDVLGNIIGASRTVNFQPTGILTAAVVAGGAGYAVGNTLGVTQGGASNGTLTVTSVSGGVVTGLSVFGQGHGYSVATGLATTGGAGTGLTVAITATVSPVLDDATYRLLLKAQIAQNHWDGKLGSLQPLWGQLFPGGYLTINDGQNMAATIILSGSFSSILQDLIMNGLIVPRPQGVQFTYVFPTLPMLGFDSNNSFMAGWDKGHYT